MINLGTKNRCLNYYFDKAIQMYKYIIFIHSAIAFTSISLFIIRSFILFYIKENKYKKISYLIDSCLAISGITLAYMGNRIPFTESWITVKLILVFLYIIFGIISFRASNLKVQLAFWVVSMLVVSYIFQLALSKSFLLF